MKYYSLNEYLKDTFNTKVYKISLNAGFTCPNRDGKLDTRGCIFCSGNGSGDFGESPLLSITDQIEEGKKRVASKIGKNGKYIAYFQAFTNTYAPVEKLRSVFTEAINHPDIVAVSIATRPDCLPEDVLALLSELNRIKPVWVELGLQTIHEKSAEYIRRLYPVSVYDTAVTELKKRNLNVIVHVILGLPNESRQDMLDTVKYVCDSKVNGIKLQLLHVLKGTDLAADYEKGLFTCLSMEEYVSIVVDCLKIIPPDIVIHRMTGDGDKKILIAPEWSKDKKKVLNLLNKVLRET
ncbi:MAG: TIGR01212 family radical SAM protein [Lachnospiraceae bacterium]|nr:TIGR01212 family radical SAM protein [Lachnospiraceae bacterium]